MMKRRFVIGLFLTSGAGTVYAAAKPHAENQDCVQVVGHVALDGLQADRLFVRRARSGKQYLYAAASGASAVAVINVSDAARPTVERQVAYEAGTASRDVTPVGVNAAILEIADRGEPRPAASPELKSIGVMDLSDPANPRIKCRFTGVSGYLVDGSRSLIYVVNGEGLWIVHHQEPQDPSVKAWEEFAAAP
jgi:hypothetical protein